MKTRLNLASLKFFTVGRSFGISLLLIICTHACSHFALDRRNQDHHKPDESKRAQAQPSEQRSVSVSLFVMSQCPYSVGIQAALQEVVRKLAGRIDFSLDYVGRDTTGTLESLHGESELMGNRIQLCARRFHPDRFMALIACMNADQQQIPGNWEACAESLSLETEPIRICAQSELSELLLRESFSKANQLGVHSSPTVLIDNKPYRGLRNADALEQAICEAFGNDKPIQCADVPAPIQVPIKVIGDRRCRKCQTAVLERRLRDLFPGSQIRHLDYADEEGKKLYQDLDLTFLPAILMGEQVRQSISFQKIKRYLVPTGEYLSLYVGIKHNPNHEICDNGIDDTNDGRVDCRDPDCRTHLKCRKEIRNRLDVFVMSRCPYGAKALASIPEVLHNFDNKLDFEVHYIAYSGKSGFKALRGPSEIEENMRQLCAIEHYRHQYKYLAYINCRGRDHSSGDWRSCTGENGIDANVIEKCVQNRGADLLARNIQFAKQLGIQASPTWLVNNRYTYRGSNADSLQQQICTRNSMLPHCLEVDLKWIDEEIATQGTYKNETTHSDILHSPAGPQNRTHQDQ